MRAAIDTPPIALLVVTWNSERTIRACLDSLAAQQPVAYPVLIIDNASVDGTLAAMEGANLPIHTIRNPRNVGFARAVNQGIAITRAPVIALINPDLVLHPGALAAALRSLERHPEVGALAPWLFRTADDLSASVPRGTVDSSGLVVTRGRRVVDRDSGQPVAARTAGPIFGATGAFAVLRRSALERVRYRHEFLDEDFFAYKEDADLAWRMARAAIPVRFEPEVRALHPRGVAAIDGAVPRHRSRPLPLARLSYRNHLLMLYKNETARSLLLDLPWILVEEAGKFFHHLVRRPAVLGVLGDLPRLLPRTRARRAATRADATVDARTVARTWFRYRR